MTRRVSIVEPVRAHPEKLRQVVSSRGGAWDEPSGLTADSPIRVSASVEDGSLRLTGEYEARVPYFDWVFAWPFRALARSRLRHIARTLDAEAAGSTPPTEPKAPWWSAPEAMTSHQVTAIATLTVALAIAQYGGGLLTQVVDYVANTYGASDAQLGVVTAISRIGALVTLAGGFLADRVGRRRLVLWSVAVMSAATALSAVAPNLTVFGALQIVIRGVVNLANVVVFVAVIEESPETARTYNLAIVGIGGALGYVVANLLLPVADLGPGAWRVLFGVGALGLLFLPGIARRLTETRRFTALVARDAERGRVGEVVDRTYGSRFALLCATGFLLNLFFAPEAQFTNRYLADERGFSGFMILVLRAVTSSVLPFVAAYMGGRLAESRGRRPIARVGLLVTAAGAVGFFTLGGPPLWLMLAVSTTAIAFAGPALGAFNTELFPTEVRGTAGGAVTVLSVAGSASGLLLSGFLSEPLGSIGLAVSVTAIAPIIVAIFLIPRLPEARGRLLDDVSPSEV